MNEKTYSRNIANVINHFLMEDDWYYFFDEKRGVFEFGLAIQGKMKKINYYIAVLQDSYLVYAFSPFGVEEDDKEMMSEMAEFVCRANYGLKNGNFELDMESGEIRFKSFVDCASILPSMKIVKNSIYTPANMFERYGTGIVDFIIGYATAKEAIPKCERPQAEKLRNLLSEEFGSSEEIEDVLAQLAERLGLDENNPPDTDDADLD